MIITRHLQKRCLNLRYGLSRRQGQILRLNAVADLIDSTRIIAAANGLRHAALLLDKINVRVIIQINVSSQFFRLGRMRGNMNTKLPFVTKEQVEEIAKTYPTPFHIYDETAIRENARRLKKAFSL